MSWKKFPWGGSNFDSSNGDYTNNGLLVSHVAYGPGVHKSAKVSRSTSHINRTVQILFIAILIVNFIVFSIEIKGAYLCQFIYADTLVYYNLLDLGQYIDGGWS